MRALPMARALAAMLAARCAMADWQLALEEDYARLPALDAGRWQVETGFRRNREAQYYTAGNVTVQDGVLRLQARQETVPNAQWRGGGSWVTSRRLARYTSGSLVLREPVHYGRVEVVARAPSGAGVWPAIWLLHEGAGQYGEIDLFEAVGKHPDTVFAGVHHGRQASTRRHHNGSRVVPGFEGRWHTHTLEWTPEAITISLDGQPWFRVDPEVARDRGIDPLRQPMQLRINLALGGSWGGPIDDSRLPASFDIRSVRVWRWAPGSTAAVPTPPGEVPPAVPSPMRWGR